MAAVRGCAFDETIQELADGFELLRQEYLGLAKRHRQLDARFQATRDQVCDTASTPCDFFIVMSTMYQLALDL